MTTEFHAKAKETKIIETLIAEEDRQVNLIKDEIRKMNKRTSDVEVC
jgi:hypothetical protein